jgi:hypothetical protein
MRIRTLALAALVFAAPTASMAGTTTQLDGRTTVAPMAQLDNAGLAFKETNTFAPVAMYWRCPKRYGYKVAYMTFPRGHVPVCHYKRIRFIGYTGYGWRSTPAAWRHCLRKYGNRVIRALESRTQYRCIYRRDNI